MIAIATCDTPVIKKLVARIAANRATTMGVGPKSAMASAVT